MGALQSARAIVVGAIDYGDADRIVTLLTREHGKLSGMAKSARKSQRRFGAALSLFAEVVARFSVRGAGAALVRLDGLDLVDLHAAIRTDLTRVSEASCVVELARELLREHEPNARVYGEVASFLRELDAAPARPGARLLAELRLLAATGFAPALTRCAACGTALQANGPVGFDPARGGALCEACGPARGPLTLSVGTRRTLLAALGERGSTPRVTFTRAAEDEVDAAVDALLAHHLERPLRARVLRRGGVLA